MRLCLRPDGPRSRLTLEYECRECGRSRPRIVIPRANAAIAGLSTDIFGVAHLPNGRFLCPECLRERCEGR